MEILVKTNGKTICPVCVVAVCTVEMMWFTARCFAGQKLQQPCVDEDIFWWWNG